MLCQWTKEWRCWISANKSASAESQPIVAARVTASCNLVGAAVEGCREVDDLNMYDPKSHPLAGGAPH